MKTMEYEKALRVIDSVSKAVTFKWWLCFGNLLHLVRDNNVEEDHDIDVGIHSEEMNDDKIIKAFDKFQYSCKKKIINDITGECYYLSFEYCGNRGLPPIDLFSWFKIDKYRFHTYDVNHEQKSRPSEYIFKGVPDKYLPTPGISARKDLKSACLFFGKWNQPLFQMQVPVPYYMGTLLDIWYPNWLKPRKMQSVSPYVIKTKSCRIFNDEKTIKKLLLESVNRYNEERDRYK